MYVFAQSGSLLITGDYSDLSLVLGSGIYIAHRAVICPRSPVIAKACTYHNINEELKLRASDFDGNGTIPRLSFDFLDNNPLSVDCIVQFMYRLDYTTQFCAPCKHFEPEAMEEKIAEDPTEQQPDNGESDLVYHVRVFALAEKYDIPHLKTLSLQKFISTARKHWGLAYMVDALREAYESTLLTVRGMRDAMVEVLSDYRMLLDKADIDKLLLEIPHLSRDLVKRFK